MIKIGGKCYNFVAEYPEKGQKRKIILSKGKDQRTLTREAASGSGVRGIDGASERISGLKTI